MDFTYPCSLDPNVFEHNTSCSFQFGNYTLGYNHPKAQCRGLLRFWHQQNARVSDEQEHSKWVRNISLQWYQKLPTEYWHERERNQHFRQIRFKLVANDQLHLARCRCGWWRFSPVCWNDVLATIWWWTNELLHICISQCLFLQQCLSNLKW